MIQLLAILYLICALLLTVYTTGAFVLLLLYLFRNRNTLPPPPVEAWPPVTVQLPVYNERYVVRRLLDAVARIDYPHLTIQLLDDSTDDTSHIAARKVASLRRAGVNVQHIRRPDRAGFKAGALAYGLSQTDDPFVAVFDADFVPPPDFLKRLVPHLLADKRLGMVQGRWGHLNPFDNPLTLGQTLAIDAHFLIEQTARTGSGLLLSFNGTGGVWRAQAIHEAGGWQDGTLTEDLDLSYRAQLAGWRLASFPDVVVPGELPPQIAAYKQQQARWAKGNMQCLLRTMGPLWRTPGVSLPQRIMGSLHLCQYVPQPLIVLLLLLTPPLMLANALAGLPLWPLGVVGVVPPLMYVVSQHALYDDWLRRVIAFPALLALGTGVTLSNTLAVLAALPGLRRVDDWLGNPQIFRRTPKFGENWSASGYALRGNPLTYAELALAAYALWGAWLAWGMAPALVPYLTTSGIAYAVVGGWGLLDRWQMVRVQPAGSGD